MIIHKNIFDPTNAFFKQPANTKAECQTIYCTNTDCPLLANKQCQIVASMFEPTCPYGSLRVERGPTKRARSFRSWIKEQKEKYKDVPYLNRSDKKLAFIGSYVYLPYAHMYKCPDITFAKGMISACFLCRDNWTVATVAKLVTYRPRAMFGGEITDYQKNIVPRFLTHVREADPSLWDAFVAEYPAFDIVPNYVGRLAYLYTLVPPYPIVWTDKDITYSWSGTELTTESPQALSLSAIKAESLKITIIPKLDTVVKVLDNAWVGQTTKFKD